MGRVSTFRVLVIVLVVGGVAARAEAQSTASLVSAAEADAAAALAANSCVPEATELATACARLRAESDPLLVRALTSYLTTLQSQLTTCVSAPRPDRSGTTTAHPRGRFAASADDADESGRGTFDMQVVVRTISTRRVAITRCYETQLANDPRLAGTVRVTMTIAESGSVTDVRAIENTTGSDAVATCVVAVVRGFRFNPGPAGGTVTYAFPFTFSPAE